MRAAAIVCLLGLVACDRPDASPPPAAAAAEPAASPSVDRAEAPASADPSPEPGPSSATEPVEPNDRSHEGGVEPAVPAPKAPPASSGGCRRDEDCKSGSVCVGEALEGCGGAPGRCEPDFECTRDAKPYCGCDGKTFRASSRCPGREYAYAGECKSDKAAAGEPCVAGVDCKSGLCEGQGCGPKKLGKCTASDRTCTTDAVVYCGCDHETFRSSSQCPGRRYRNRGDCHR